MSLSDSRSSLPGPVHARLGMVRAVCTPVNLLLCGAVTLGWLALVGWTGAGPDGWQARLCADLDLRPRACAAVRSLDEAGRAALPADAMRSAS